MKRIALALVFIAQALAAGDPGLQYRELVQRMTKDGLSSLGAFSALSDLTAGGPRLSGSEQSSRAIESLQDALKSSGCDSVWTEPVMVPHWVRGRVERARVSVSGRKSIALSMCALGGSGGTSPRGIVADVIEVHSIDEAKALGEAVRGKIVFYNRPMDRSKFSPGEAYGGAVGQRGSGANMASRLGAVGVLVRSMTMSGDDVPHTGSTHFDDSVKIIPAAALGCRSADKLSEILHSSKRVRVAMRLDCRTLPDVESANVIGEIRGSEFPKDIIVLAAHTDSWDKGTGAHDDGAGCVHVVEALRLLKHADIHPKRTVRAVLYINEENGLKGGQAYAAEPRRKNEHHIAAIETDAGGFTPRGFGVSTDSLAFETIKSWSSIFESIGADRIRKGGGGADISPLSAQCKAMISLNVDGQRYFDYHHSANDTVDKVHPRELELGAIALAGLAMMIAQEGI
ncbi:MAG: M20/M25/M40 family metallo-hydrolase [Ignavibacteriales bacterium]|nr:M20/M25/M40 family metallo-hydrolase [Ignavibacteriales bacterium]